MSRHRAGTLDGSPCFHDPPRPPAPRTIREPMTDEADPDTLRRKRLLYQSRYRGTQEADLLIGGFAACYLSRMTAPQLDRYERLLDESDVDLVNWLTGRGTPPEALQSDVLSLLMNFKLPVVKY